MARWLCEVVAAATCFYRTLCVGKSFEIQMTILEDIASAYVERTVLTRAGTPTGPRAARPRPPATGSF